MARRLDLNDVNVYYGGFHAVQNISPCTPPRSVAVPISPSDYDKSTVLRSLGRMHEIIPGAYIIGGVPLDGGNVYGPRTDPVSVRNTIGMAFQRPSPFPTMPTEDSVVAGLKLAGIKNKARLQEVAEKLLRDVNLWDEVKDRLNKPGGGLSGDQQQRLCIARAIAVEPEVLLMGEPCPALDPISTLAIKDLIHKLKAELTIVIVTHNMRQATRVFDQTTLFSLEATGKPERLVEVGPTKKIFKNPEKKETGGYISGRFG